MNLALSTDNPYDENNYRNAFMVFSEVVDVIITTSIHLEYASTIIKNIRCINGPAKSISTPFQGALGHNHGFAGAFGKFGS